LRGCTTSNEKSNVQRSFYVYTGTLERRQNKLFLTLCLKHTYLVSTGTQDLAQNTCIFV